MQRPALSAVAELLKPITWFPPMWAFGCGVVASGLPADGRWPVIVAGVLLAGPFVCATSQAVNDWFDRHVDAINEPQRPIPSGRMPGHWGLYIAVIWTALSLLLAWQLGVVGFLAGVLGLLLAWAYSAPPLRLKRNGWWGNAACGLLHEFPQRLTVDAWHRNVGANAIDNQKSDGEEKALTQLGRFAKHAPTDV